MLVIQVFIFKDGQFLGNEMATGTRIEIGRDPSCEVYLDDETLSRKHCFIFEHDNRLAVQDAGSYLGTKVNGEITTTPRYLGPRDDVTVGRFTLKFKQMAASGAQLPAPASEFHQLPATSQTPATATPTASDIADSAEHRTDASRSSAASATPPAKGENTDPRLPASASVSSEPAPVDLHVKGAFSEEAPFEEPSQTAPLPVEGFEEDDQVDRQDDDGHRSPSAEAEPASAIGIRAAGPSHVEAPHIPLEENAGQPRPVSPEPAEMPAVLGVKTEEHRVSVDDSSVTSAWIPATVDDDDDDDDVFACWSIVDALVSRTDVSPESGNERTLVDVLHYRNQQILDHAELEEGGRFFFGRIWTPAGRREAGIPTRRLLVRHRRGGVAELLLDEDLSGLLLREGQSHDLRSLPEVKGKGKAKIPLTQGDLASLEIFGDRVFVRIGKAPAIRPTKEMLAAEKQQRKLTASAFGVALSVWLMLFVLAWIAQYRALAETVVQLEDEGFAVVVEPELELEDPEPELEEPKMVEEAKRVEQKEAPKPDPTPAGKTDAPRKVGVLDALKNVPKQRAGNQSLSKAMSNIKGVRVPGATGFKVSQMVGKGPKGVSIGGASGGVSSTSLNSILRKGGGTGNLASKKGRAVKGRVKTLKRMSKIKGRGQLSKDEIMKVINKQIGKIQYCYEKQLRLNPGLSGKVQLEWVIATNGRVKSVKSTGSSLKSAAAINCMSAQVKRWKFPKPRGKGTVIVKFPFVFNTL